MGDLELASSGETDYATFNANKWRGDIGLELNLPIDRLLQPSTDFTLQTPDEMHSGGTDSTSRSPDPVRRRSTIRQGER